MAVETFNRSSGNLHRHAGHLLPGIPGGAAPEGRGQEGGGSVGCQAPEPSVLEMKTPSGSAENFVLIKASKRWLQPTRSRGLPGDRTWGMPSCSLCVCLCVRL